MINKAKSYRWGEHSDFAHWNPENIRIQDKIVLEYSTFKPQSKQEN